MCIRDSHSIMQLVGKLQSLDRVHGVVHTMSSAYRLLSAQHHFWVVDKIPVDGKSVLRLSGLSPFRHDVQRAVPFLEEDEDVYKRQDTLSATYLPQVSATF